MSEALEAGKNGEVWGVIHFGHNFSEEFEKRQADGDSATLENIIRSRISINMDSSSKAKLSISILLKAIKLYVFLTHRSPYSRVC